jgi:hypothetical protein
VTERANKNLIFSLPHHVELLLNLVSCQTLFKRFARVLKIYSVSRINHFKEQKELVRVGQKVIADTQWVDGLTKVTV